MSRQGPSIITPGMGGKIARNIPGTPKNLHVQNQSSYTIFVAVSEDSSAFINGANLNIGAGAVGAGIQRSQKNTPIQSKSVQPNARSTISLNQKTCYLTVARKSSSGIYHFVRVNRRCAAGETWVATNEMFQHPLKYSKEFC